MENPTFIKFRFTFAKIAQCFQRKLLSNAIKKLLGEIRLPFTVERPGASQRGAILVDLLQQEIDKQLSVAATASAVEADTLDVKTVPSRIIGAFQGKIHVARCSHVGGHVHAGNVAVVSKDGGVMFGCVTPADVPLLAKSLISSQPVVQSLMSIETLKNKVRGALLAGIRGPKF